MNFVHQHEIHKTRVGVIRSVYRYNTAYSALSPGRNRKLLRCQEAAQGRASSEREREREREKVSGRFQILHETSTLHNIHPEILEPFGSVLLFIIIETIVPHYMLASLALPKLSLGSCQRFLYHDTKVVYRNRCESISWGRSTTTQGQSVGEKPALKTAVASASPE